MDQFIDNNGSLSTELLPTSNSDKGSGEEAQEANDRMVIDDVWDPLWDEDLFLIQLRDKLRTVPAYGSSSPRVCSVWQSVMCLLRTRSYF
jgi:hypothetical protein